LLDRAGAAAIPSRIMSLRRAEGAAAAVAAAFALLWPSVAGAVADNDIVLGGLVIRCGTDDDGGMLPCFDPSGMGNPTAQDPLSKSRYKLLGYQLGVALAPHFLAPAETLGYNGFQVSIETTFTTFNRTEDYWKFGTERHSPGTFGGSGDTGVLHLTTIMVRKGLPWSIEIAAGGSYLSNSEIATGNLQVKWSIFEGFYDLIGGVGQFLPDIAVRGSVSRAIGTGELDLTVSGFDISASKPFGIGGMWSLTPYLGWHYLIVSLRSEVVDFTPEVPSGSVEVPCVAPGDPPGCGRFSLTGGKARHNDVFQDEDIIVPGSFFGGFRIIYSHLSLVAEVAYVPGLTEVAPSVVLQDGSQQDIRMTADAQWSFSFALAGDF
jgi:hypothetical protein